MQNKNEWNWICLGINIVGRLYWIWEWKSNGPTARGIGKSSLRGGHHSGLHSGLRPPFRPSWCPPLREDFPIPRAFGPWDFYNSNSSSGIGAATPIPIQWNWGDSTGIPISKFPTLCSPLKRRKRQLETPSSLLFSNFFSFSKGYRVWEILKSESQWNLPNSVESELELQLQFQVWNWNGGSIQFQNSPMELELELTELFQTLPLSCDYWS